MERINFLLAASSMLWGGNRKRRLAEFQTGPELAETDAGAMVTWLQVSLFAELFNEMLIRDFGFCIYNALVTCPHRAPVDDARHNKNDNKKGAEKRNETRRPPREMKNSKEMSDVRDKSDNNMKMDSDKTTEVCMFTTFGKMSNFLVVFLHSLSTFFDICFLYF